jgi:hypothetical protein
MSYLNLAEDISHGIAGPNPNTFQKMASHGMGYLGAGVQKIADIVTGDSIQRRGARAIAKALKVVSPTTRQQPRQGNVDKKMSQPTKKQKFKAKMAAKKAAKQEVRKEMGKRPPRKTRYKFYKKKNVNIGNKRNTRNITAPVAYGTRGFTGNRLKFRSGMRDGCVVMESSMRIGYFQMTTSGDVDLFVGPSPSVVKGAWPLSFCMAVYNDPVISGFAVRFERFNVRRFRFRYVNTVTTAQSGKLYFIYTAEPGTVKASYNVDGDGDNVQAQKMNSKNDLWEVPIYSKAASRWYTSRVSDTRDMCATAGAKNPNTDTMDWSIEPSDLARQIQGALLFAHRSIVTPTADYDLGDLFIDFELELCDIALPPVQQVPSLRSSLRDEIESYFKEKEAKREEGKEIVDSKNQSRSASRTR